jgi:exopolyphosphatase/guanosine-5'-triphosphate,3'-diphosphate pyrophosphatase
MDDHRRRPKADAYAALDLGTNNCRLLVARPAVDGFRVVDAFSRIVRLGEGVAANGHLREEAILRTLDALGVCAEKIRRRGARRTRAVATEACRRAANAGAFVRRVMDEVGLELEVISPREEVDLALLGCRPLIGRAARYVIVFDIGGGSTELSWVRVAEDGLDLLGWTSLPCGVVSLAERHGGDRIAAGIYEAIVAEVGDALAAFDDDHGIGRALADDRVQMIGTSGTVTTLAGLFLGLPAYDRRRVDGIAMRFEEMSAVAARLLAMDYAARAALPCVGPERADLVVVGCAVLEAILRRWPIGWLRVADRGLREGILLRLMAADGWGAPASP